jgi:hypothetical protein
VSPTLPYLLKIALFAGGVPGFIRKQAQAVLLENLTSYSSESGSYSSWIGGNDLTCLTARLNLSVLTLIPTMISTVAIEDKWIVMKLGGNREYSALGRRTGC